MSNFLFSDIDVEGWAFKTLRDSAEFNDYFNTIFSDTLNYYSSSPEDGDLNTEDRELLPCLTTYYTDDETSSQDVYRQIIVLPFTIRVIPDRIPSTIGGGKAWDSPKKLRQVAIKATQILEKEASGCGIDGNGNVVVIDGTCLITPMGEKTEEIQASITLAFGIINTI